MTPQTNPSPLVKALDSGVTISGAFFDDEDYLDHVDGCRRYWQVNQPKEIRCKEWLEMYPELGSIIKRSIRDNQIKLESKQIEQNVYQSKIKGDFNVGDILANMKLFPVENIIDKLSHQIRWLRLGLAKVNTNSNSLTDDQIQQARDFPVEDLIDTKRIRRMWCCPFHEEDSPSFHIYRENSWHCFGCSAHGKNAIDFVMKKNNLGFVEAVRFLIGGQK